MLVSTCNMNKKSKKETGIISITIYVGVRGLRATERVFIGRICKMHTSDSAVQGFSKINSIIFKETQGDFSVKTRIIYFSKRRKTK